MYALPDIRRIGHRRHDGAVNMNDVVRLNLLRLRQHGVSSMDLGARHTIRDLTIV